MQKVRDVMFLKSVVAVDRYIISQSLFRFMLLAGTLFICITGCPKNKAIIIIDDLNVPEEFLWSPHAFKRDSVNSFPIDSSCVVFEGNAQPPNAQFVAISIYTAYFSNMEAIAISDFTVDLPYNTYLTDYYSFECILFQVWENVYYTTPYGVFVIENRHDGISNTFVPFISTEKALTIKYSKEHLYVSYVTSYTESEINISILSYSIPSLNIEWSDEISTTFMQIPICTPIYIDDVRHYLIVDYSNAISSIPWTNGSEVDLNGNHITKVRLGDIEKNIVIGDKVNLLKPAVIRAIRAGQSGIEGINVGENSLLSFMLQRYASREPLYFPLSPHSCEDDLRTIMELIPGLIITSGDSVVMLDAELQYMESEAKYYMQLKARKMDYKFNYQDIPLELHVPKSANYKISYDMMFGNSWNNNGIGMSSCTSLGRTQDNCASVLTAQHIIDRLIFRYYEMPFK